ncbi:MAG TPA: Ig-like domain-containing protein, partial [Gemmatimonadaceae bacterium]|nr:Ig-like domain-containing protein [Gemmatimonadaceae bacterium]
MVALTAAGPLVATSAAQTIGVNVGASASVIVAPGAKLTVPIVIDLTNAGAVNIASLQATLSWGTAQLTLDSVRVVTATGWTFLPNVGASSVNFAAFNSVQFPATGTLVNAYFTASGVAGGTRVVLAPISAGNAGGVDITSAIRARSLDVAVATTVKWGDVDDNNAVNIIDAQQITRFSAGLSILNPAAMAQRGDVTADGAVNIIDAQQVARFSVLLSSSPRTGTDFVPVGATTAVNLSPSTAQTLVVGRFLQVTATPLSGGTDLTGLAAITWGSSNPAVATVNTSGFVVGVSAGSTNITATSGGITSQITVNAVAVPVASVTVSLGSPAIQTGTTTTATATTRDASNNVLAGRVVAFSSSNTAVATVNASTGVVTGVSAGTSTIFATSEGITGSATVTVTAGTPTASVTVSLGSGSIQVGATTSGTATARDASNNVLAGKTFTWSSSNTSVATVNASTGVVTGVGAGSTNIIATADGVPGQAALTVLQAPVASVTVAVAGTITVGATATATTTLRDAANNILTGRIVTWSSSNTSIATVNSVTGIVTGVANGSATIFATSEGITGSAPISVVAPGAVSSVTVNLNATTITAGATTNATAVLRDANNNVVSGTTTWSTSNGGIASVNSSTGVVTGVTAGTANIIGTSGSITGQRTVTISAVPVSTVTVSLTPSTITVGSTVTAAAQTFDANNNLLTGRVIAWASANTSIATVDPNTGVVTGVAAGTVNIQATSESRVGQATLTVSVVPVASVTVTLTPSTIAPGGTMTATAVTKSSTGQVLTGRVITWSSSVTSKATVNANTGVVTGVALGTTNIVATSEGVTGQALLTVANPTVASITISLTAGTVVPSGTSNGSAVAKDASGNTVGGVTFSWTSNNTGVATVNASSGVVTGVAIGSATITVSGGGATATITITVATTASNEPAGLT